MLLDFLREASEARLEMHAEAAALDVRWPAGTDLPGTVRAQLVANRPELLNVLDCGVLGDAIGLGAPVPRGAALVVARLLAERGAFTVEENEACEERGAIREHDGGAPRWLAELAAIEDVLAARMTDQTGVPSCRQSAERVA